MTAVQRLRESFLQHQHNWVIRLSTRCTLVVFFLACGFLLWRWTLLPREVPLWYLSPWGEDRLAPTGYLSILPASIIFWYVAITVMTAYIPKDYFFFTQLLFLASALVSLLSFMTLLRILFLVS